MKKIFLITTSILAWLTSHSQVQLGILTDLHHSYLYNKSDVAADERLDYVTTFKPSFGLEFGYAFSNKVSVHIAPQYFGAGQKFNSVATITNSPNKAIKDNISLNYLQIPLHFRFTFGKDESKVKQFIQVGAYYASLLNFQKNTVYESSNILSTIKSNAVSIKGLEGETTSQFINATGQDSFQKYNLKFDKSLFNKQDYGLNFGYGVAYTLNKNFSINANLYLRYGLAQIDNLDTISVIFNNDPNNVRKRSIKDVYYCRNDEIGVSNPASLRDPKSNNIFTGLHLSFVYTFPQKKSNSVNN